MQLEVLFIDNHLLVVNKPTGLLTQPSGTDQPSLEAMAKAWIKEQYQKPGNVFLEAVHRLDKPVSGVVVFGRTSKALTRLNAYIRNKETQKIYFAIVEGIPSEKQGTLEHWMIHDDFRAEIASKTNPNAKLARLSYEVVQQVGSQSLLKIVLETGRYHQIRLQLSSIGCPIVGDQKYGSNTRFDGDGIALHHGRLTISHPVTQELMTFEAPNPKSFSTLLES